VEPSEGSHPGPIASASQAAGLRPVVLCTVLAMRSGLAWPIALYMALTSPPGGQQRRARPALSSPAGGSPSGSEPGASAVIAALASLRRDHRQVIVCTFYEHLSADDAAARLGIPVRDVKRRACSALDEIRRILKERGVQVPCQPVTLPGPG
jgi:Sigma-70, region 4